MIGTGIARGKNAFAAVEDFEEYDSLRYEFRDEP